MSIFNTLMVVATVISYNEFARSLYIRLQDDTMGYIPTAEISKFHIKNPGVFVNHTIHVIPTGETFKGMPVYSAKRAQEIEYQQIHDDFINGRRNTYTAKFLCTVSNGAVALYTIAPGIVGGIGVQNFCINRFRDLSKLPLPKTLPVTILSMEENKIHLSALPAFGTFKQNIEHLGIQVGDIIPAYCTGSLTDGNSAAMVTPNLATLISCTPAVGEHIWVRVKKIDFDRNQLKSEFVGTALPGTIFKSFSNYVFPLTEEMVDIDTFIDATKTKKKAAVAYAPAEPTAPVSTDEVEEAEAPNLSNFLKGLFCA